MFLVKKHSFFGNKVPLLEIDIYKYQLRSGVVSWYNQKELLYFAIDQITQN